MEGNQKAMNLEGRPEKDRHPSKFLWPLHLGRFWLDLHGLTWDMTFVSIEQQKRQTVRAGDGQP